ncbi:signal peptidase I [Enterococcus cecorum]|nr:signal peptidase I [Enterococcus cecorum]
MIWHPFAVFMKVKNMKKTVHAILNILGTILIFVVLIGILVNANSAPEGKGFFGFKGYTVLSNSMRPTFSAGDYVVDKIVPYNSIKQGDVISYHIDGHTIVTHRVKEVTDKGFIMQGDANNAQDAFTVTKDHFIGKMIFMIPMLGRLPELLLNPILWLAGAVLILGIIIYGIYQRKVQERESA